jgi:hypothetical protein
MINFNKVFNKIKQAEVITHYWHLRTDSYARHLALGAFYENITDILDDLAEKSIKYNEQELSIPPAILLNLEEDHVKYFTELSDYIGAQINLCSNDLVIQDILIDAKKLVDQTLYLFKLS